MTKVTNAGWSRWKRTAMGGCGCLCGLRCTENRARRIVQGEIPRNRKRVRVGISELEQVVIGVAEARCIFRFHYVEYTLPTRPVFSLCCEFRLIIISVAALGANARAS